MELPQSAGGHGYSQIRNIFGGVDRVDYFGGVPFSIGEKRNLRQGISLGNFLNIWIEDEITESFEDRVINDPLFMHEYGHTYDSQLFGSAYLLGIGIPSAMGADWTELRANRYAARYFKKYYGVNWTPFINRGFPLNR